MSSAIIQLFALAVIAALVLGVFIGLLYLTVWVFVRITKGPKR